MAIGILVLLIAALIKPELFILTALIMLIIGTLKADALGKSTK